MPLVCWQCWRVRIKLTCGGCKQVWPKRFCNRGVTYIILLLSGHQSNLLTEQNKSLFLLNYLILSTTSTQTEEINIMRVIYCICMFLADAILAICLSVQKMAVFTKEFHMWLSGHTMAYWCVEKTDIIIFTKSFPGPAIRSLWASQACPPAIQVIHTPWYVRSFRLHNSKDHCCKELIYPMP